jgi:hypothetical protein
MKKLFLLALAGALMVLAGSAVTASAQSGGGCALQGSAGFSPGLSTTAQNFSYSFTGSLSNCQSSTSGAPASGTVFAGTNGLPVPTGNGSCASSTTSGIAVIQWSDASTTVIQYTTSGAAAAVSLQGTVIPSVTTSTGTTYTTTRYTGDTADGQLVFQPPSPTSCQTGATTAGISGATELGSAS